MPRLALLASLLAVTGCYQDNPESCQNAMPSHPELCMTGGPCKTSSECASTNATLPVCDLTEGGGTCVLCTAADHAQCTGMMPRCEAHACVACVDDGDCGTGGVCMLGGDCAAAGRIIHAKVGGSNADGCGAIDNACSLTKALATADASRNVIKL